MFSIIVFKNSKYDKLYLTRRETNDPEAYKDYIRSIGAPNKTGTDNARVLNTPTPIASIALR